MDSAPSDWTDVLSLKADKALNPQISFVQTLDGTGSGDVNLDYYAITVDRTDSAKRMLADFRKRMGELLFRKGALAQGFYAFRGYDPANEASWSSDFPKGALMTFVLFQGPGAKFERGSVVVSCADDTSFVFSTVNTAADGDHPVSGNRAFGIVDNGDGSVTLFTKAADRVKGASFFDLLGSGQRAATFAAGASIWEHLLDNISLAYARKHPLEPTKLSHRLPYARGDGTALSTQPPEDAVASNIDGAAFRTAVRELPDARALSGGQLSLSSAAQMARDARAALDDAVPSKHAAYAYSLGLLYGASYSENLDRLLRQHVAELGNPTLDQVTFATAALVGDAVLEPGEDYQAVLRKLPAIPTLPATDPAAAFREALAALSFLLLDVDKLKDQATAAIKDAAYDAVNREIDAIRTQVDQQASATVMSFASDNLDLDQSQVDLIVSMRKYLSLKESIRLLELRNIGELSNVLMKRLVISGHCVEDTTCAGIYLVEKLRTWKPNLDELASWAGEIALDEVAPGASTYLTAIASYADKIRAAAEAYEKIQSARHVFEAAEAAQSAIQDLGRLDFPTAINEALSGQLEGLRAGLNGGTGELCAVAPPGTPEPASCRLLAHGRLLEDASQRLATSLAVMDRELKAITAVHGVLQPLVTTSQSLATIAALAVRPRIEEMYAAAQALRRKVAVPDVEFASTLAGPILGAAGLTPAEVERRAAILASVQKEARRLAGQDLAAALARAVPPGAAISSNPPAAAAANGPGSSPGEKEAVVGMPVTLASLTLQLASLYEASGQTTDTIRNRLKESSTPFVLFRQFPPYFYSRALVRLASEPKLAPLRKSVETYRGWVVGDPHLENFGSFFPLNVGTITQLDGPAPSFNPLSPSDDCRSKRIGRTARLVMNDLDDGGEGSAILDLVRYLVGLELYSPGAATDRFGSFLDIYIDAVTGSPAKMSDISSELLKNSNPKVGRVSFGGEAVCTLKDGMTPGHKYVSEDATRFIAFRPDAANHQPLSEAERAQATEIARGFVGPNATILDSYKY